MNKIYCVGGTWDQKVMLIGKQSALPVITVPPHEDHVDEDPRYHVISEVYRKHPTQHHEGLALYKHVMTNTGPGQKPYQKPDRRGVSKLISPGVQIICPETNIDCTRILQDKRCANCPKRQGV